MREARAASALNHPHIVTIHDIGSADGIDFIAMEFVDGSTLDRQIGPSGLSTARAIDIAVQVAEALDKAQSAHQGALKRLSQGKGNLIRRAEDLRELGVAPTKRLPGNLLDAAGAGESEVE